MWRLSTRSVLLRAVALLAIAPNMVLTGLRIQGQGSARPVDLGFVILGSAFLLIGGYLSVRTRVRLVPEGVEVREFRTTFHAYDDIRTVGFSGSGRLRMVRLTAHNGAVRNLPVPISSGGVRSDRELEAAAVEIQRRCDE